MGSRPMGSVVVVPRLYSTGSTGVVWPTVLVALQHMGSSQIRDQTHVSCIGWRILYHWATKEAPKCYFWIQHKQYLKSTTTSAPASLTCSANLQRVPYVPGPRWDPGALLANNMPSSLPSQKFARKRGTTATTITMILLWYNKGHNVSDFCSWDRKTLEFSEQIGASMLC